MKKLVILTLALAMVLTSSIGVFASEPGDTETEVAVSGEFVSNMDAETYLETRLAQIDEALAAGLITQEQADLLIAHVEEVASEGSFGAGPENGYKGQGNAECILGEDGNFGIFSSQSAGQRTGNGNGVGLQKADGTGNTNSSSGRGNGQGNRGSNRGLGVGIGNNVDCILD